MNNDVWRWGRMLYQVYKDSSQVKMVDFDNLALYQKETWQKAAQAFTEFILNDEE